MAEVAVDYYYQVQGVVVKAASWPMAGVGSGLEPQRIARTEEASWGAGGKWPTGEYSTDPFG